MGTRHGFVVLVAFAALAGCGDQSATDQPPRDVGAVDTNATDTSAADASAVDAGAPSDVRTLSDAVDAPASRDVDVVDSAVPFDAPDAPDASDANAAFDALDAPDAAPDAARDASADLGADAPRDVADDVCAAPRFRCGGVCVDLFRDPENCGRCGSACGGASLCNSGSCIADDCPGGDFCGGVCRRFSVDVANCGGCGRACALGQACYAGVCSTLPAMPPFEAVAPCASLSEYAPGDVVALARAQFVPRCLAVRAGAVVTFRWPLDADPLAPAASRGTAGNPIPATSAGSSVAVTFAAPGFFPYYSTARGSADGAGFAGVVYVIR